jgi:two-component system, NtrC family, sensor histidine kinase HydH
LTETILEEMKRFARFDADDERLLRRLAPHAAPHFREITEAFYRRLDEHEDARGVFSGPQQVERLKQTLCAWMTGLLSGPWDRSYFEARARVGAVHVRIGVAPRYVCGAMDLVRRALAGIATDAFSSDQFLQRRVVEALDKAINLDLAIILETYAEAQVERVRDLEQRRLSTLRTLTAGLAHEIRNPLNAAHLQLVVAGKRLAEPALASGLLAAKEAVSVADRELERLAALLDEFLKFATPHPLQRESHDLRDIARQAVASLAAQAEALGAEVVLLPGQPARVSVDKEKMTEVVLNLVRNACEASGAGARISVSVILGAEGVSLEVEDDGPGLPSPPHRVFEPFFTTKSQGTGLGLSIVQRIVTEHGGEVTAARRDGRTVFTVRLPH